MPVRRAQATVDGVEQTAAFEALSRAGFVARGVVYGIIGILAIKLALGAGGKTTDQSGALKTITHQPLGEVLLILVAIGLAGYSLWRLSHAVLGHGPERSDSGFDRLAAHWSADYQNQRQPLLAWISAAREELAKEQRG